MKTTLLVSLIFFQINLSATIWFVDITAIGSNDGTSWENAFVDLQNGISSATVGDKIWVAAGIYKPTATNDRTISFQLATGVEIFGGFNGTEIDLEERDLVANETTMSGDIGEFGEDNDNTYRVVRASNVANTARLDGFRIILGYGQFSLSGLDGAGLSSTNSSPTIANCTFTANYAGYSGGAVYQNDSGILTMINCVLKSNVANSYGGAISVSGGTLNLIDCDVSENQSGFNGGAFYINGSNATLKFERCIISGNVADNGGGAGYVFDTGLLKMYNSLVVGNFSNSDPVLRMSTFSNSEYHEIINCTIAHNKCDDANSTAIDMNNEGSIYNCIIWGNTGDQQILQVSYNVSHCIVQNGYEVDGDPLEFIYNSDPEFINPSSLSAAPFNASGFDYSNPLLSPSVDMGSSSWLDDTDVADLAGNPRLVGSDIDLGCYELMYCTAEIEIETSGPTTFCIGESVILTATDGVEYIWSNGYSEQSQTVSQSGDYSVTVITDEGCIGSNQVTITVQTVSVNISGNEEFCEGSFTTLNASGAGSGATYEWSDGQEGNSIVAAIEGWFVVTATAVNDCVAQDSVFVSEAATPNPPIFQNGNQLSTGNFSTYQWYFNGIEIQAADNQTYTPQGNGDYYVVVTNSDGCQGASDPFNVNWIGIDESPQMQLSIYPNPVSSFLTIENNSGVQTDITIINQQGEIVALATFYGTTSLNITHLSQGLYSIVMNCPMSHPTILKFNKI